MRKIISLTLLIILGNILVNCSNDKPANTETTIKKNEELSSEFVASYIGVQESYNLLNTNGEEMVINGDLVTVPSSIYKFIIRKNKKVILVQITKEGTSTTTSEYYGDYEMLSQDENQVKIKCSFQSGEGSNPEYVLRLNNSTETYLCNGTNEPELILEKR
jgi:hypothetical protein